jgi:hypothetical protein
MGEVWLARHETLDKDVAVKILPSDYVREKEAVERFLREARSAARLEHPNVVQVLDAGTAPDGTHFIVMQYVDGTDLEKILKKKGKFEVSDALAITKKVAQALGAAHKLGIVHRDIKPSNIMLTRQSRVMVADFGLARESGDSSLTGEGHILGTPQYLAPEQARGEAVDARSDLYSLGGSLYTFLTGKPPYTGVSPVSVAVKHADPSLKPDAIRSIAPEVPSEVEAFVAKLMAKKREDRFQSAEEVVAAVDRLKSGGATVVSVSEDQVLTPRKKRRLMLAGGCLGILALFAFVIFLAILGPNEAQKALRKAVEARTDEERIVLLRDVVKHFPNTPPAAQAAAELGERFQRELKAVVPVEGKVPAAAFDVLRKRYPEQAGSLDTVELGLHRARLLKRSETLAGILKSERGEVHENLLDFVPPEAVRKQGEASVRFWVRVIVGAVLGVGTRFKEIDVREETLKVEPRKTATIKSKVLVGHAVRPERRPATIVTEWTWFEDDWYLGENSIREEK